MISANELRRTNKVMDRGGKILTIDWMDYHKIYQINKIFVGKDYPFSDENGFMSQHEYTEEYDYLQPIPLTEDILLKCGFEVINENSAGKRYGIVENHIFNSDTILVYWNHNRYAGKIFRGDMEIKSLHQLQNLIHALTNKELEINI